MATRRGDHHHAHDLHERLRIRHEEEHHGATHAEHRQELHQRTLLLSARQLRRRLENDLLRGHFGRQGPGWALDDDLAHNASIPLAAEGSSARRPVSGERRPRWDPTDIRCDRLCDRVRSVRVSSREQSEEGRAIDASAARPPEPERDRESREGGAEGEHDDHRDDGRRTEPLRPDNRRGARLLPGDDRRAGRPDRRGAARRHPGRRHLPRDPAARPAEPGRRAPPSATRLVRRDGTVLDSARSLRRPVDPRRRAAHPAPLLRVAAARRLRRRLRRRRLRGHPGPHAVEHRADPRRRPHRRRRAARRCSPSPPGPATRATTCTACPASSPPSPECCCSPSRPYAPGSTTTSSPPSRLGLGSLPNIAVGRLRHCCRSPPTTASAGSSSLLACAAVLIASLVLTLLSPRGDGALRRRSRLPPRWARSLVFAAILTGMTPTETAAVCTQLAVGALAFLPGLSMRFARLPIGFDAPARRPARLSASRPAPRRGPSTPSASPPRPGAATNCSSAWSAAAPSLAVARRRSPRLQRQHLGPPARPGHRRRHADARPPLPLHRAGRRHPGRGPRRARPARPRPVRQRAARPDDGRAARATPRRWTSAPCGWSPRSPPPRALVTAIALIVPEPGRHPVLGPLPGDRRGIRPAHAAAADPGRLRRVRQGPRPDQLTARAHRGSAATRGTGTLCDGRLCTRSRSPAHLEAALIGPSPPSHGSSPEIKTWGTRGRIEQH